MAISVLSTKDKVFFVYSKLMKEFDDCTKQHSFLDFQITNVNEFISLEAAFLQCNRHIFCSTFAQKIYFSTAVHQNQMRNFSHLLTINAGKVRDTHDKAQSMMYASTSSVLLQNHN